ncbi:DUF655 domain-containing protein [Candidatus Bathyarchaeota archaeon]|nr:DUF655 domain-containing protein [Candidatus Bathyarchaeota archaeon]
MEFFEDVVNVERKERSSQQIYEEYAYVIDYLPYGKPGLRLKRGRAIVQLVGEEYFTLLEAVVREGVVLKPSDRVYVGKDSRKEILYILGRTRYDELTANAKMELESVIEKIVLSREKFFVNFFNTAKPITPRMHALELIPGIGKKYMWKIIEEREKKPFESFQDLQKRVNIPNPAKLITKRIIEELSGDSKYRLFTRAS